MKNELSVCLNGLLLSLFWGAKRLQNHSNFDSGQARMTGRRYEIHKKHFFTPMESSEFAKLGKLRVRITISLSVYHMS